MNTPAAAGHRAARAAPRAVRREARRTVAAAPGGEAQDRDVLRWAIFLFIVFVISTVHAYVRPIALLRPGVLLWLVVMAYPILQPRSVRLSNLGETWPPKVLVVLFVCSILSMPFGLSIGQSGKYFLDVYSRVLLFAVVLLIAIRSVRDTWFFVWAYVTSIGILALLAVTVMKVGMVSGGIQRLQGEGVYDSNDMGVLFNVGLPLTLLCMQTSGRKGKLAAALILVGIPVAIAKFGSRGALVGLVAVGVTLFFSATHVALMKRLLVIPVLSIALAVAAPAGYWQQMQTIINPGEDYNLTEKDGRKALAQRGISYMARYPVFGVGLANFGRAEATISSKAKNAMPGVGVKWTAPHNTWIQVGAELGLIALTAWVSLILGGIVGVFRLRRRIPERWMRGTESQRFLYFTATYLPAAFVGFAVPSTFVSHTYLPHFYILVAYLTALQMFTARELRRERLARRAAPPSPQRPLEPWRRPSTQPG